MMGLTLKISTCPRAVLTLVAILLTATSQEAGAQRTVRGQFFGTANVFKPLTPPDETRIWGGEAFVGQYMLNAYWQGGVQFFPKGNPTGLGCFTFAGGYMLRAAETRSRMFNLYLGGNAILGADFGSNPLVSIIDDDDSSSDPMSGSGIVDSFGEDPAVAPEAKTAVVWGIEPRMEMEVFFMRKAAFVIGVAAPLKFKSQTSHVSARGHAGIRVNF